MMGKAQTPAPAPDTIAAWEAEAAAKATETIEQGNALSYGIILGKDPNLHYITTDGDLEAKYLGRFRARFSALGYRDVSKDVDGVIGINNPVVMAIPMSVYRQVLRKERLRKINELARKHSLQQPNLHRQAVFE